MFWKFEDIDLGYGGEEGIIYLVMYFGIWFGYGDVDGNDYWCLWVLVVFDGFVELFFGDK